MVMMRRKRRKKMEMRKMKMVRMRKKRTNNDTTFGRERLWFATRPHKKVPFLYRLMKLHFSD